MADIEITILTGASAGDVFRFNLAETPEKGPTSFTIGRSPDCELVLQQSEVSRRHASILRRAEGFFLSDLGSSHGTQHMGFPLQAGEEGARRLSTGDEFKIGDMLFRVGIPEEQKREEKKSDKPRSEASPDPSSARRKKLITLALPVLLLVLVALWFFDGGQKGGLPAQRSKDIIFVPSYSVFGNYPGSAGDRKDQKDTTHIDMAQFELPSADLVVEYELFSEAPIEVKVDDALVEIIAPSADGWQFRGLLIRDLVLGKPRKLVFDNTDFPRKPNQAAGGLKKWGVRNVRATPIPQASGIALGFTNYIQASVGLTQAIDKSADGLFLFVRSLQSAAIQLMHEQRIDAASYHVPIDVSGDAFSMNPSDIQQKLNEILLQSSRAPSAEAAREILRITTKYLGQFDGEIWRRVNNRIMRAKTSVKVQNSIEAHDQLMSAMNMFPPESDYRWALANRMYLDPKVVPKLVRERPDKYRP